MQSQPGLTLVSQINDTLSACLSHKQAWRYTSYNSFYKAQVTESFIIGQQAIVEIVYLCPHCFVSGLN